MDQVGLQDGFGALRQKMLGFWLEIGLDQLDARVEFGQQQRLAGAFGVVESPATDAFPVAWTFNGFSAASSKFSEDGAVAGSDRRCFAHGGVHNLFRLFVGVDF